MKLEVFTHLINQFDNGDVQFNLGDKWSFLFNNKWYPIHAFMKEYYKYEKIEKECNLHQAVFELSKFIPLFSSEKSFYHNYPVENK